MKYLIVLFLLVSPSLKAEDTQETLEANAYQTYRSGKKEFNAEKVGRKLQKALNAQVKFGSHHLMRKGLKIGKIKLKEWETNYSKVFLNVEIGQMDLGDHEAIAWLLDFYNILETNLGLVTLQRLHLDDMRTFAYAIPVVFSPARSDIDKPEYKLHFVPFSKGTGYWLVLGGCSIYNWIGTPVTTLICDPIAEAGRLAFGLIGDPLSDAIWEGAHNAAK